MSAATTAAKKNQALLAMLIRITLVTAATAAFLHAVGTSTAGLWT